LTVHVVFVRPDGVGDDWLDSDTWRRAREMPAVAVHVDPEWREARRFHALTSGATVVYDGAGRLVFAGGLTGARGHAGDNDGRRSVLDVLVNGAADPAASPVFGCPLEDGPVI
jgi:hypothetical protein